MVSHTCYIVTPTCLPLLNKDLLCVTCTCIYLTPVCVCVHVCVQAGSPQLALASHKDKEPEEEEEDEEEKENTPNKPTIQVAGTDVPLREKVLKKSTAGEGKQGLSLFDNRAKVLYMYMCTQYTYRCICTCTLISYAFV